MSTPITVYQQRLGLEHATWARIEHKDAMVAIVYKIVPATGSPLILKICPKPGHYAREEYCLRQLAGAIPMPQLIQAIPPEPSIDGALLMEYLSGSLLTAQSCTDALAYTIGATLAKMHMHRLSGYGDLANPKGWHTDPRIYFNERFEGDLHECRPHLSPAILQKCRAYHDAHLDLLLFVDGPCITHRDFRPGNIIVDNRHLKGIIDWSGARASFAQEDFCAIEYGGWHTVAPEMKPSLLAGYKSVRPIPEYHAIMPLLQLNRALATIGFLHKRGIWDSTQKRLYTLYRQFLEDL